MSPRTKQKEIISTVASTVKIFIVTIVSLSALIFIVFQITSVNSLAIENDQIREKLKKTRVTNNRLAKEVNELKNYNRIEKLAEKLGLKPAKTAPRIIAVNKEKMKADLNNLADKIDKKKPKTNVLKAGF